MKWILVNPKSLPNYVNSASSSSKTEVKKQFWPLLYHYKWLPKFKGKQQFYILMHFVMHPTRSGLWGWILFRKVQVSCSSTLSSLINKHICLFISQKIRPNSYHSNSFEQKSKSYELSWIQLLKWGHATTYIQFCPSRIR